MPAAALTMKDGTRWPSTNIPVCWENPKREHKQERDLIRKSVGWTWEKESALEFTGWRACTDDSAGIRIALENSYPRTLGRGTEVDGVPGGLILPALWSLAALSVNLKAPVHEFGHALGFGHEHARADAPEPELCGVTDKSGARYVEDDTVLTLFDVDTIMVACVANATRDFSLGTPALSAADIFGLVRIYGSHPDNVLGDDTAGDRFGAALLADDFNGDGVPDLAVAAPGKDGGDGAVFLYLGDRFSGFRPWQRRSETSSRRWANLLRASVEPSSAKVESKTVADVQDALQTAPGKIPFPSLTAAEAKDLSILEIDLDEDGLNDLVVGAPFATGGMPGSGVVVVLRARETQQGQREFLPWYWFGQSY